MNADVFAEWLRRQGHTVIRTASSYWYDQGPRVFQAFPYHWQITPDARELATLFYRRGAGAVRFSAPAGASGKPSYHVVCEDRAYSLAGLAQKARYDVRQGLRAAEITPIPLAHLAADGWDLRHDTLVRQGRTGAETARWWRQLCESAAGLPGIEAWGALVDGSLAAALLALRCDDWICILYQQSAGETPRQGVNHALTYTLTRTALARPGITRLFYGLESLDAPPTVDAYKFRLGYTARPVRQHVVFHPWLAPLVNALSHRALRVLRQRWPTHPTLAKAEGMVRFYREARQASAGAMPSGMPTTPPA